MCFLGIFHYRNIISWQHASVTYCFNFCPANFRFSPVNQFDLALFFDGEETKAWAFTDSGDWQVLPPWRRTFQTWMQILLMRYDLNLQNKLCWGTEVKENPFFFCKHRPHLPSFSLLVYIKLNRAKIMHHVALLCLCAVRLCKSKIKLELQTLVWKWATNINKIIYKLFCFTLWKSTENFVHRLRNMWLNYPRFPASILHYCNQQFWIIIEDYQPDFNPQKPRAATHEWLDKGSSLGVS